MSTSRLDYQWLANFISNVASPPVWMMGTAVFAALATAQANAWLYILIYSLPVILLSTAFIFILYYQGIISDLHVKSREERVKPMFAIAFASILSSIGLSFSNAPSFLVLVAIAISAQLLGVALLTTFWKVSLHATTASACIIMAYWFSPWLGLLLIPILIAVVWARLWLQYHTPGQIAGGIVLSLVTLGLGLLLFA
ncbi:MAG: hypothetical protein AAF490_29125 [Chloroflexota bacterium]